MQNINLLWEVTFRFWEIQNSWSWDRPCESVLYLLKSVAIINQTPALCPLKWEREIKIPASFRLNYKSVTVCKAQASRPLWATADSSQFPKLNSHAGNSHGLVTMLALDLFAYLKGHPKTTISNFSWLDEVWVPLVCTLQAFGLEVLSVTLNKKKKKIDVATRAAAWAVTHAHMHVIQDPIILAIIQ